MLLYCDTLMGRPVCFLVTRKLDVLLVPDLPLSNELYEG